MVQAGKPLGVRAKRVRHKDISQILCISKSLEKDECLTSCPHPIILKQYPLFCDILKTTLKYMKIPQLYAANLSFYS